VNPARRTWLRGAQAGGALLVAFALAGPATAAPDASPLAFWKPRAGVCQTPAADDWNTLLKRYLRPVPKGVNRFDYATLEASAPAQKQLAGWLAHMTVADVRGCAKPVQMAYWINLYNALTVKVVLDHYPVKSITKIHDGPLGFGPWDDPAATVLGQNLTLNDIEHRILRPYFKDPRIHYAVNCASLSCPNLAAEAYTAANLDSLLDAGARAYVNHPRGVAFDGADLRVSSIYHWYREDFGGSDAALIRHWMQYAQPALKAKLADFMGDIDHDYDWNLNQP
jgi:hypothetical protein